MPSHEIFAEQSVLGAMMLNRKAVAEVADLLVPDDFTNDQHQAIYRAILACDEAGQPTDSVTVSEAMERQGTLDGSGGLAYLGGMAKDVPSAANVRAYARVLRDRALSRSLASAGREIAGIVEEGGEVRDQVEQAQRLIMDVNSREAGEGPRPMMDAFPDVVDRLERRNEAGDTLDGTPTGFGKLDSMLSGLCPGLLYVLAARPGMGKTGLAMAWAEGVARSGQVLVFSMEMPRDELLMRSMAANAGVEYSRLKRADMDYDEWSSITAASNHLKNLPIDIDDSAALSSVEMRARARQVKHRKGLGLIVVDYLQLMRAPGAENRTQEITQISQQLKALAKDLQVPVVALSQLNRGVEQRPDKRPRTADLRESGSIEQDADVIAFLYRQAEYHPETDFPTVAELDIAKHRQGEKGRVLLNFIGAKQQWGELDMETAHQYLESLRSPDEISHKPRGFTRRAS